MKFGALLKKELRGLINAQTIFGLVFTMMIYILMGQLMGSAMEEGMNTSEVNICDQDKTEFTEYVLSKLEEHGSKPNMVEVTGEDYAAEFERLGIRSLVVIPEGFTKSILEDKKPADVIFAGEMSMSMLGNISSIGAADAVNALEGSARDTMLLKQYGLSDEEIALINKTDSVVEYTVLSGKSAKVPQSMLMSVVMAQSMVVPFALFFLLFMASQMIMTAISNEKIDKTLETLLSAPVPRTTILSAKMLAAFIVALMNASVMIIGFVSYILGLMGSAGEMQVNMGTATESIPVTDVTSLAGAMSQLGMNIGVGGYIIVGIQLLLSVSIGLCIALILGAMAEDVQSLQSLLMPIMIMVLVPFFVTMFTDYSAMNIGMKILFGIIPFTHSYTALGNLMTKNYGMLFGGLAYQILFLAGCMYFAVKMFTTDRIFTMTGKLSDLLKKKKRSA